MASFQFKGFKVLTEEQHKELLEKGYYTLSDGTQVAEDPQYVYVSKDTTIDDIHTILEDVLGV